ncbi:L,D-transpeptidase [Saccharibacillus sp. CPCC 101409]|uniref:L,D-transpeptidase n=1 Tax=Saccharibacillus sp. CPCC 101409 TaxID=3058041 RepID=UPI002673FD54|nr:L,D-transpeptidase [Saccharibacillus sp. CPCC 101409]MDO3410891.1 L,D-transpeptidase [Saccharibacillus sp. CPCC 101409]
MKRFPHLKKYVREHPDNKMAWYLLGKEYEADGQPGKANYCFNQAREIYEAYEHAQVPEDILEEYEAKLHEAAKRRDKKAANRRRWLLLGVLLLLAGFRNAEAPGISLPSLSAKSAPTAAANVFTAVESGSPAALGTAAAQYMRSGGDSSAHVLGLGRKGKWLIWNRKLPVTADLAPGEAAGESVLRSYDPKTCDCKPPDSGKLRRAAAAWAGEQESLAALGSAMTAYRASSGKLPDSLEQLKRPFPDNTISGATPEMRRAFDNLGIMLKREAMGQSPLPPSGEPVSAASLGGVPYFTEPLEIIVDRGRHRLAVVSGEVLLRNYEVGLGGDKTPAGTYTVTDKVVNPNGRSDGEFGSRGMQLSDTDYAIHGTDDPDSIGGDESHGCVRMNQADIEELFDLVPSGTQVTLTDNKLPEETVVPGQRFQSQNRQDQTNDRKVYKWLN